MSDASEREPAPGGRDESPAERADRNWNDLLQELRVSQTGVQLMAGFLVTLPFQQRFEELDDFQRGWYLGLVALALVTVVVTLTPVAIHRRLFRAQAKDRLVTAAHRLTQTALLLIALLLTGIALLVFDVVVGGTATLVATGVAAVLLVVLLGVVPWWVGRSEQADQS